MTADQLDGSAVMQEQIDDLRSRVDASDERATASESRADKAELRADDSATRADAADNRADAENVHSKDDRQRIADVEERLDVHDEMIAELQAEGLISSEQAKNLEIALETARVIGSAIGVVMTLCKVTQMQALTLLKKESMDSNRKLKVVAEEVVLTGYATGLPPRQ